VNIRVDQSVADDCVRIKDLCYSSSRHVRMYGERFDIVSDLFPDGDGIAVQVTTDKDPNRRALRLPISMLVGLRDLFPKVKREGVDYGFPRNRKINSISRMSTTINSRTNPRL
jgi:hypothetical protein